MQYVVIPYERKWRYGSNSYKRTFFNAHARAKKYLQWLDSLHIDAYIKVLP